MPALVARASPSRLTHVVVKAMRLLSSFMVLPSPSAPTWNVARPSGSSTGRTRATGSSSPPTMNTSIRFSAPMAPPVRGASTRWCPDAARRLAELAHDGRAVGGQVDEDGTRRGGAGPGRGDVGDHVRRGQREQRDVGLAGHRRDVRRGRRRRRWPPWPRRRRRGRPRRCRRPRGWPRWPRRCSPARSHLSPSTLPESRNVLAAPLRACADESV